MRKIHLYISNDLEALSSCLAENLNKLSTALREDYNRPIPGGSRSFHSVFQPFHVVSQTVGMNIWLKSRLADNKNLGIAANIRFLKPNELVSAIYAFFKGERQQLFSVDQLQWVLYSLLDTPEFTRQHPGIAGYYSNDPVKRIALAGQLADLFDQYQIYRYDMIASWNEAPYSGEGHQAWQSWLWHNARKVLGNQMSDKTEAREFIRQQLRETDAGIKLAQQFPQIHLFGNSILTPFHTELLYDLSMHIGIHIYFVNPAPEHYWLEDKSSKEIARKKLNDYTEGNSLMVGWGKITCDTLREFLKDDVLFNCAAPVQVKRPAAKTLLQKLQRDIFDNAVGTGRQPLLNKDLSDGTVIINACYTPAREVEVLKDYLLHLIDTASRKVQQGQQAAYLSPKDIVVMVPDIDAYAPFIESVMEEDPEHLIPYTIADRTYSGGSSLLMALETILSIDEDRCNAEEVMQLLDYELIRQRFGITDAVFLRRAVAQANIRFGLKGCEDDDSCYVSWENGLRRLLLGYCMKGVEEYEFEGNDTLLPLEFAEGSQALEVLRLLQFVKTLELHLVGRKEKKTIRAWANGLEQMTEDLLCEPDKANGPDHRQLAHLLEKLRALDCMDKELVDFAVFKLYFLSVLSSEKRHSDYQHGGVTFCSMIPMRSVPYKVVALLGMNNDQFPRKDRRQNFNLIDGKEIGDRSVKDNDKHLFLETLVSAGENLYISYVGQSSKDNSILPPSILVDELIDYVDSGVSREEKVALTKEGKTVRSELVCRHPLLGFSTKYSAGNNRLYTFRCYAKEGAATSGVLRSGINEMSSKETVSIEEFINFFKHPFKAYYNKVLDIYYSDDELLLPGNEKFELGTLDKWQIKDELLKATSNDYERKGVKVGKLPLKNMASLKLKELAEEVEKTRTQLQEYTAGASLEPGKLVHLHFEGICLEGKLPFYSSNRLIVASVSDSREKYWVETYLRYLMARAMHYDWDAYLIQGNSTEWVAATAMTPETAKDTLKVLVQLYQEGHKSILPFFPGLFRVKAGDWKTLIWKEYEKKREAYFNQQGDYGFVDPYLKQEYRGGFFNKEGVLAQLQSTAQLILPQANLFQNNKKVKNSSAGKISKSKANTQVS